jgi:hypothetical protein
VRVAHKYDDDFGHSGMSNSERSIPFLACARVDAPFPHTAARRARRRARTTPSRASRARLGAAFRVVARRIAPSSIKHFE